MPVAVGQRLCRKLSCVIGFAFSKVLNESDMNRRVLQGLPMVAAPAALSHDEAAAAPPLPGRCMGCYGKGFRAGQ